MFVAFGFYKQIDRSSEMINSKNMETRISVVIAVRNEELTIQKCINSILNQHYDNELVEIIIVDDHSTDNTLNILAKLSQQNSNVHYFKLEKVTSKKEAIKLGVEMARNRIIATTDADCILPREWLKSILLQFNNGTQFLYGPVMFNSDSTFINKFQQLDFFAMQGLTFGSAFFKQPILCNAANMAFNKEDYLEKINKLESRTPSGDDIFLLNQFKHNKQNSTAFLNKIHIVTTNTEVNLSRFIQQRLRWASKTKFVRDNLLLFFTYLVFISNIILLFIYGQIAFIEQNRVFYIILLVSKWLIDFILLFLVTSFFEKRKLMCYFLPVQLIYPIYILTIGLWSQFFKFKWKERTYNG